MTSRDFSDKTTVWLVNLLKKHRQTVTSTWETLLLDETLSLEMKHYWKIKRIRTAFWVPYLVVDSKNKATLTEISSSFWINNDNDTSTKFSQIASLSLAVPKVLSKWIVNFSSFFLKKITTDQIMKYLVCLIFAFIAVSGNLKKKKL